MEQSQRTVTSVLFHSKGEYKTKTTFLSFNHAVTYIVLLLYCRSAKQHHDKREQENPCTESSAWKYFL